LRDPGLRICSAAIFAERVKPAHIIRKVILRRTLIVNYLNPF